MSRFGQLVCRVTSYLDKLKHEKRTATYTELALAMGGYAPRNKYLAIALGTVLTEDFEQGNPLRSALVVRKDSNNSGGGFFWMAKEVGAFTGDPESEEECFIFWKSQVERLGLPISDIQ